MLRHSHVRAVLAAMLMVLALAPMATAFAVPGASAHSCCREDAAMRSTSTGQEDCCYISARPNPAPAAVAPVKRAVTDAALVSAADAIFASPAPANGAAVAGATWSPPILPNCSSILRI